MTSNEIMNKVTEIFRDVLNDKTIQLRREMTANDIEGWDSLSHISIIGAVEKEFNIRFDLADLKSLKDVGKLLDLVEVKAK